MLIKTFEHPLRDVQMSNYLNVSKNMIYMFYHNRFTFVEFQIHDK